MRRTIVPGFLGLWIISVIAFGGCTKGKPGQNAGSGTGGGHSHSHSHGHSHGHGPNGGHIVELDTIDYHVELTQDEPTHKVGVYLLDGSATATMALPTAAVSVTIAVADQENSIEYKLEPAPKPEDGEGKSSYFEVANEPLWEVIAGVKPSQKPPELLLTIDGKTFTGEIVNEHAQMPVIADGHSHGADEPLVWHSKVDEGGYQIELGHHGVALLAGGDVEPAVQITRNGEPVANAKVFNALIDANGEAVLAEEVATIYEPPTAEEPAHYAQGALKIPPGTRDAILRFRVLFPEGDGERTFDVPVSVK